MNIKYPMGWDVAYNNCNTHWDPILGDVFTPPDWSAGITPYPDFVICKASQALFDDFTFASNWQQLGAKGTCRGAYHFYQDYKTPGAQANYFVQTINDAGGVRDGDVLVMDWEEEGKMSLKKIIDFIWNIRRLTGIAPERTPLYSRKLLLGELNFDTLNQSEKDYIKTIPLWIAGTFNDPDQVDEYDSIPSFFIPDQSKWGPVVMWQYGLDVNPAGMVSGFPGGLDFDWISPAYFEQWKDATGGVIIPPPPTGEEMSITAKVNINGLNFRDAPVTGTARSPQLMVGDSVEGDLITPDNWMHVLKVNGVARIGYVAAWYLIDIVNTTPPPSTNLPVLHLTATADGYETKTFDLNPL